jgi:alpha-glucosidase
MCGVNTWGPDIGGFFDAYDGSTTAESTELWIRWCQFGALTPLMRDHLGPKRMSTPGAVDLWSNEQTVATWRRFAALHNALFPFFYAYAKHAHEFGLPTMRHMVLEFPDEPEALRQDHQYLLGNELLVAPVVKPNASTRQVWLPPGPWYGFWDDATFSGPGYVEIPAPIDQIPILVRAGSALPLLAGPVVTFANADADALLDSLELRLYPARDLAVASHGFTFHDGSTIQVEQDARGIVMTFDQRNQARNFTIRLPVDFELGVCLADGAPIEGGVAGTDGPRIWDVGDRKAVRIQVPHGVASLSLGRLAG